MTPQFWVSAEQTKVIIGQIIGKGFGSVKAPRKSAGKWIKGMNGVRMCLEAQLRREAFAAKLKGTQWYTSNDIAAWGLHSTPAHVKDDIRRISGISVKYVMIKGRRRATYQIGVDQ